MPVDVHPEVQDAELASYGGWQEQEVQDAQQPSQPKSVSSGPMPLLDEDDLVSPEQIQQEHPWWMQPFPRMVVAGSSVMAVLYLLFSMFGLWGNSSEQPSPSLVTTDAATIDQEVTSRIKQLQTENEDLKRDQIMGEPLPQGSPQQAKPVTVPPKPTATSAPRRTYATQSVASRPSYPPPAPRPLPYTPPPARAAVSYTPSAPRQLTPVISKPSRVETKKDPMEQWLAAANVGNYGGMSPVSSSQTASQQQDDDSYQTAGYQTGNATTDNSNWQPTGGLGRPPIQANSQVETTNQQSDYLTG